MRRRNGGLSHLQAVSRAIDLAEVLDNDKDTHRYEFTRQAEGSSTILHSPAGSTPLRRSPNVKRPALMTTTGAVTLHYAEDLFQPELTEEGDLCDDRPLITIPKGWGYGAVESVQVTCQDHISEIENKGFNIICVPSLYWKASDDEFRSKTSMDDDRPNTTDVVMRQMMHASIDNHIPKLKRKSLLGGPIMNRFLGRVLPPKRHRS